MIKELEHHIEKALGTYTTGDWYQELLLAKEEYFKITGQIFETDDDYEERMAFFNNWYLFEYIPSGKISTIIKDYVLKNNLDAHLSRTFLNVRHSCYFYKGKTKRGEKLKDTLKFRDIIISDYDIPSFLEGDLFLGYSIGYEGGHYLLEGHCPLPRNARSLILDACARVYKKGDPHKERIFLMELQKAKTKNKRYKHLSPEKIFIFK